ncbi:hypothetical protein QFC19_006495 [Naganishia cerealis]|uniref:Uncharacterized protein n=1 Tax=Naganishia cerealis TaxID=610337 RepID=A0ACC2VG30_9TREE|nr:hypothetical protein QFC19_006495 [Naganishia cerealis]
MTTFDLSRFRVGLGGAHGKRDMHRVVERGTCDLSAGDELYLFPSAGSNVTSSSPITFKWNPDCLPAVTSIDLYLYTTSQGLLHSFPGVDYSKGEYAAGELDPRWWNYTTKASVYLAIVDANVPRWLSQVPVGPTFDVYTAKEALSTTIVQGGTTIVTAASVVIASSKQAAKATATTAVNGTAAGAASDDPGMFSSAIAPAAGLPKGAIAAAIVVPVLVVGLMVALYVKFARLREREKRKRWSEHVDKRMSTLSADWRQGAPTASIYSQGAGRPTSMFSTATGAAGGATGRPVSAWTKNSSVYAMENNIAGRGVTAFRGPPPHARRPSSSFTDTNNNNNLRPASIFTVSNTDLATMPGGVRTSHVSFADGRGARQSRVSFGDALRPSKSTLSINVPASTSNNNNSAANKGKRMSRAEPSPTAGRHSIDGAHAMMASRSVRGTDVATVSPTQAAGPFAVPAVPASRGRSGSTSGGSGVAGFFSTITSAVGLKDKKQATTPPAAGGMSEEEWKQAEATRRSADGVRDMEAIMLRRSQAISQHSQYSNRSSGVLPANDTTTRYNYNENVAGTVEGDDAIELLDTTMSPASVASPSNGNSGTMRAPSPMGMMGMPMGANPDQLLAAYAAARAAAKSPTAGIGQSIEQRGSDANGEGSGNAMTELAAAAGVAPPPATAREDDE